MHVSVIITPSLTKASIARCSRSSIQTACLSSAALLKSVPRGSVIVGMRTRRSATGWLASISSQATPASPRLSVSAMMCAWVTGTKSSAPKKSPTLIWCCSASCRTGPISPASIACSCSVSRMSVDRCARLSYRLAPLDEFMLLELGKFGGRVADHRDPLRHQQRAKAVRANDGVDRLVELVRDRWRKMGRGEHAPPRSRLEVLETGLGERRHVGRGRRADPAADGEQLEPTRAHLRQHRLERVEHQLDLPAEKVRDGRRTALVRDVLEVGAGRRAEHLAG